MSWFKSVALNGILLAVVSHALIGGSLVWDKVLLKSKETQNLVSYVFWLGAISIFGLALLPFGLGGISAKLAAISFGAGLLDLIASFFYYSALKAGEASDELAAVGGFGPVATALIAIPLLKVPIGGDLAGFVLMSAGGFAMFFAEHIPLKKLILKVLLAAVGFGLMNVLQKIVFKPNDFCEWIRLLYSGNFRGVNGLTACTSMARSNFQQFRKAQPKRTLWYMVNRFMAGVGSFLVFAISRTSPAVVQGISGVRYAIIFVAAYLISKLNHRGFVRT